MTLYCGIDLHASNPVISIINNKDTILYEKRLPNDLPTILNALLPYQEELCGCVVEPTVIEEIINMGDSASLGL